MTTNEKGKALENLIQQIFPLVPGVRVWRPNTLTVYETEEVDVWLHNDRPPGAFTFMDDPFPVECKNWSRPVGSDEVVYFAHKLQESGCRNGVLIAAKGVTGDIEYPTAAQHEISVAQGKGSRVLVLTRQQFEALATTEELIHLLRDKNMRLAAYRSQDLQD